MRGYDLGEDGTLGFRNIKGVEVLETNLTLGIYGASK